MIDRLKDKHNMSLSLDMISPGTPGHGMPLRVLSFIGLCYGEAGVRFFREARDLGRTNGINVALRDQTERQFFRNMRSIYDLPRGVNPRHFYMQQQEAATNAITELVGRFPSLQDTLDLSEEARIWTEHPTDPLKMLAWSDQDINPRARFEIMRRMFLSHIDGQIRSQVTNDQPRSVVLDAQLALDNMVYENRVGDGEPYEMHTYHDPITNTFKGMAKNGKVPPSSIERRHPFIVRTAREGVGAIFTKGRVKAEGPSLLKALAKANKKENGRIISPEDVTDHSGMLFVVMDETKFHPFIGQVLNAMQIHPRGVVSIEGDNGTGNDRGQASNLNCHRFQVVFDGSKTPLELMFYKPGDYLNQLYEVGKRDRSTGHYLGKAHELYELRRVATVLTLLFPEQLYGDEPKKAIEIAMHSKAQELLHRNRVNREYAKLAV